MDFSTIIGILAGFILMVWGIGFSSIKGFLDLPSAIIVVGGTLAALVANHPFSVLKNIPKHLKIMMQEKRYDPVPCIEKLVGFSLIARKEGLLALESRIDELSDPFFQYAVRSIVDMTDPDTLRTKLTHQIENLYERHAYGISIYEKGSSMVPAFGMVGTLIGLIKMLKSMDLSAGSSSTLGESMSVALVTTFYGVVIANLIFGSIAKKLSIRNDEECLYKQIIVEGILSIQSGENPQSLRENLYALIEEKKKQPASQKQVVENGQMQDMVKEKAA